MKPSQLGVKAVAVLAMIVFSVTTFAPMAWAGDNVILTFNTPTRLENMEVGLSWFTFDGKEMDYNYPSFELVAIDGVPWQDTSFAEDIKKDFGHYRDLSRFEKHPELLEIVLDKRFNGRGFEVWELLEQGKSASEVKEILLSRSPKTPKAYAFDCKPISKNELDTLLQSRYGVSVDAFGMRISGEPTVEPPKENGLPDLPSEAPDGVAVVLYLDRTEYSVAADGTWEKARMDAAPVNDNGRTLVPLRGVLEQFGATVDWLPEDKQIETRLGDKEVTLTLGSIRALVNGKEAQLDIPPKVVDGHTLIPSRFVSEQLGMSVKWDGENRSITIRQGKSN